MTTLATRRPELVAGLLPLDPASRGFVTGERFPSLAKMASAQTSEFRRMAAYARKQNETGKAAFFETVASEHESFFAEAGAEVAQVRTLGAIPVVVIGAEVAKPCSGPDAQDFQRFWIESNKQIAGLSSSGKFVLARGSTHQIHRDAPDMVVREATELVAIARSAAR